MTKFAAQTAVPVEKSRAEIEGILRRYGADGFRYGWADREGKRIEQIEFTTNDRMIRFTVQMPSKDDRRFKFTPARHHLRSEREQVAAWEQACRQRWRALCLAIKAKLEAVECGISEFETEFMAFVVDPETRQTMGEILRPQIAARYAGLSGPIRLPGLPAPEDADVSVGGSR